MLTETPERVSPIPTRSWNELLQEAGGAEGPISYDPLPDGDYDVKVIDSKAKIASSGKTMYVLTCEVQSGPHRNRRLWTNLVVSPENPSALGYFFRNCANMGVPASFFASDPSDAQVAEAFKGKLFKAAVTSRVYQNQMRNEIKGIFPPSTGAFPGTAAPPPSGAAPWAAPPPAAAPAPPAPPSVPAPPPIQTREEVTAPAVPAPPATAAAPTFTPPPDAPF